MEGGGKARRSALQSRRVGGCARLSPLDVRCAFIKNQYRSVLIGSSLPREGEGVRASAAWECGAGATKESSSDKCLIVISRWSGSPQTTSDSSSCIIL